MIVRYRDKNGKFLLCECLDKSCPKRSCFDPGHTIHSSHGAYNGAWQDKHLSCVYRDYHGCPDAEEGDAGK